MDYKHQTLYQCIEEKDTLSICLDKNVNFLNCEEVEDGMTFLKYEMTTNPFHLQKNGKYWTVWL